MGSERPTQKDYQAMLFTQLILNGKSVNEASIIAKEAVDKIIKEELPTTHINVG